MKIGLMRNRVGPTLVGGTALARVVRRLRPIMVQGCAGMRGRMVDNGRRLLTRNVSITGDPALVDFQHLFALLEASSADYLRMWIRSARELGDITVQGLAAVLPGRLQHLDLRFGDLAEDGGLSSFVGNDGLRRRDVVGNAVPWHMQWA